MPKQFSRLVSEHASTFQDTAARVADGTRFGRLAVLTHADARFIVAEQLAEARIPADILLEPERRDSAAAVAVAALHAARTDPQAVVLILAADHVIGDTQAFVAAVEAAAVGARAGHIMTLGIEPTHPATAYGYIHPGPPIEAAPGTYRVARFVEKPDRAGAERLIAERAVWNSGYFLFRADVMIGELEAHAPAVLAAARAALETALRDLDFVRLDAEAFGRAPKTSIDYAVMERTRHAGVLPVS
ncbi:mannose-1-phosphate guanylyltransferase/mannose-6-phosphate isomerase, partial [Methylobacterium sp. BE186]|nr:mannose-1-phosphate guanylyltransferase/mannose-6-phosphate isomerase [Methylobacterium sp. BE186]